VQFHPEVHHTRNGTEILRNFVFPDLRRGGIVDAAALHRLDGRASEARGGQRGTRSARYRVVWIRRCGSPGGSRAARCERKVAADLHLCDNGVLRKNEFEKCSRRCATSGSAPGCRRCYGSLSGQAQGVSDPETKRKIIATNSSRCLKTSSVASKKKREASIIWCKERFIRT